LPLNKIGPKEAIDKLEGKGWLFGRIPRNGRLIFEVKDGGFPKSFHLKGQKIMEEDLSSKSTFEGISRDWQKLGRVKVDEKEVDFSFEIANNRALLSIKEDFSKQTIKRYLPTNKRFKIYKKLRFW